MLDSIEESVNGTGDFSPNDIRKFRQITDQTNQTFNSNLSYGFSPTQTLTLNLLYQDSDPPRDLNRTVLDYDFQPPAVRRERELYDATRDNWEIGFDYNIGFEDGGQLQIISINNEQNNGLLRDRFLINASDEATRDLSLLNNTVDSEEIFRGVYTRPIATGHNLEIGLERSQTTLDTELNLERLNPSTSQLFTVPLPNANSTIEETRIEGFAVHHWQLNPRMKLESTLTYEVSEIAQTGDFEKSPGFRFCKTENRLSLRYHAKPAISVLN